MRTKEERKNLLVKKKEAERMSKGLLKAKERQALKDRQKHQINLKLIPKKGDFLEDIWENDGKYNFFIIEMWACTCKFF